MLNDELIESIVPTITACREDYFIKNEDNTIVSGQYGYSVPTRAVGGKIDRVQLVNPTDSAKPSSFTPLGRISPTMIDLAPNGWYFEDNKVKVVDPTSNAGQILRVYYECRPNYLVDETSLAGQITNINTALKQVTLSSVPSSWVSGTTKFDLIQQKPPFDSLGMDEDATIASLVLTFTNTLPTDLAVGDWISEATCSPIAQIPLEFQNLLCQGTAMKCLEAIGDKGNLEAASIKYQQMEDKAIAQITPRANKSQKYLTNRYSLIHDEYPSTYV
jgi:hypothetical protein